MLSLPVVFCDDCVEFVGEVELSESLASTVKITEDNMVKARRLVFFMIGSALFSFGVMHVKVYPSVPGASS